MPTKPRIHRKPATGNTTPARKHNNTARHAGAEDTRHNRRTANGNTRTRPHPIRNRHNHNRHASHTTMLHTRKNNTRIPASAETTNTSMRTGTHRTSPHQDQTPQPHISPDRNTGPATTVNMHTDTGTATSAPNTSHSTGNQPRKPIRRKQPKPRHNHPISHVFAHVNSFCFRNDNQPAQKHGKNQTSHFHTLRHPNSNNKQKRLKSPKPRGKTTTKQANRTKNQQQADNNQPKRRQNQ